MGIFLLIVKRLLLLAVIAQVCLMLSSHGGRDLRRREASLISQEVDDGEGREEEIHEARKKIATDCLKAEKRKLAINLLCAIERVCFCERQKKKGPKRGKCALILIGPALPD